jgi:predicted AAA+ superfamily ATPase
LFAAGLSNVLAGRLEVKPGTPSFGRAMEHLTCCELRAWQEYRREDRRFTFWRAHDGSEADFVIGDEIAIDVKGSPPVTDRDPAGLRRLAEETSLRKSFKDAGRRSTVGHDIA